jgi:hypothetical protein
MPQVCTTVLAHMIPDYLSPERQEARAPLSKAITGVLNSVKIANFCRRCLAAEDNRQQAVARYARIPVFSCLRVLMCVCVRLAFRVSAMQ